MKKQLLSAVMLCTLGLVGCDEDNNNNNSDAGTDAGTEAKYNTVDKINTYLEGKTLTMSGANIPSHPNGYDEDVNYGSATQCYQSVVMQVAAGTYNVTSTLGTLRDASQTGSRGTCDHETKATELKFSTTAVLIENVAADGSCFDVTYTYTGFKQAGRGQISQDGQTVKLELFFEGQATGNRCANGAVGAATVTLNGAAFTGNAVQVYTVSQ
jgi:hypothetical protein